MPPNSTLAHAPRGANLVDTISEGVNTMTRIAEVAVIIEEIRGIGVDRSRF
jgi:hypothetical protein